MTVGVLVIEIIIPSSTSLKEKRFVISSIKDRLRKKFNVSVAEIDFLDKWQRSQIGIATIGNEYGHVESSLQNIFRFLDDSPDYEIVNYTYDYV